MPTEVRCRTRHELALAMLDAHGALLPHRWVTGDDEMGRASWFRRALAERGEHYLLAVPANTLVRDLDAPPPPGTGRGRPPTAPFGRVAGWCAALPRGAWARLEVRLGEKGPVVVEAVTARVQAKTDGKRVGPAELLVVGRERQADGTTKHDYYLSDSPLATPLAELARMAKARHRIEECLQRAQGKAGLAHYEVRTWVGWHHQQALSLLATWFLTMEIERGKK